MNKSKNHHYIPQFLIRNFCDSDGLLYVYNKQEKRIISRKLSPKSIFFEVNRNTVSSHGNESDDLEQLYSAIDTKISSDLNKVLRAKTISPDQLVSVLFLASLLKWRTPLIDQKFASLKGDLSEEHLRIKIRTKNLDGIENNELKQAIFKSQLFIESKRILIPFLPLFEDENLLNFNINSFINTNEHITSLIGDCPIIEDENLEINCLKSFIFPISTTDTFIYWDKPKKSIINTSFYLQKDLAVLHLSEKYVACRDINHLQKIIDAYNTIISVGFGDSIVRSLFN